MKTDKTSQQWEKVHVFISSTFNDMHAERDYLVKRVFPELQDWCERRKLRLVDIDLRWGVTEQDASHNKNVVKVCLSRIDDCRPFFLCFLGQRRGWVPKEGEVSKETFASFPDLRPVVGAASVTEMEILHALINPFHHSLAGKTANSAEYYERAKYAFFYLRDPSYLAQLPNDPSMLREIYTNDCIDDPLEREVAEEELARWREREVPDSNRPFHFYQAKWDPTATTPELMLPLECPSEEAQNRARWHRQWQKAGVTVAGSKIADDASPAGKAAEFNTILSAGRLSNFQCEEAPFSKTIISELQAAIAERFPRHSETTREDELQREIDQQEQFLFTASEGFIEREGDFAELDDYVESDSHQLFVLTAQGGMGKSTLLANWVERYRRQIDGGIGRDGGHSIHFRFIGQSDGTTTVYSLLRLLLGEIKEIAQKFDEEIPLDPVKLRNEWPELLEAIGKRGKTVIVIDALNQLESGLTDIGWLTRQLPDDIKLIVSFKRGDEAAEKLYDRFSEGDQVKLSEVQPFANVGDRQLLVQAYLKQYLKELDGQQLEALINLHGTENPLYLKVVLSELRVFGAYGNLEAKIRSDFGDTPVSAFVRVLERLENDPAYSPIDPKKAVPLLFGLLAHARRGLSVDELTSLFIQALGLNDTAQSREDAADTVNLFLRQVRSFLARREGRYDFFFESFKTAAQECYVAPADSVQATTSKRSTQAWHGLLANYFGSLPTWQEGAPLSKSSSDQPAKQPTRRKVAELPHHLIQAEQWQGLEETLCDLTFLESKVEAGLVSDLVPEFAAAARLGSTRPMLSVMPLLMEAVRRNAHFLVKHPTLLFQCLWNASWWNDTAESDRNETGVSSSYDPESAGSMLRDLVQRWRRERDARNYRQPWIRAVRMQSEALAGPLNAVFPRSDRAWGRGAVSFSPGGHRVVASGIRELRLLEIASGAEIVSLKPEEHIVNMRFSPRGDEIALALESGIVLLDSYNLTRRRALVHSDADFLTMAYSPDGKVMASGHKNGAVTIWDLADGIVLSQLEGHGKPVMDVGFYPTGERVAIAYEDGALVLWDLNLSSEPVRCVLEKPISRLSISPCGKWMAGAGQYSASVLDAITGNEVASLAGVRFQPVTGVAISSDGERIGACGSEVIGIWAAATGRHLAEWPSPGDAVVDVAFSPDGVLIAGLGQSGTIRIWDGAGQHIRPHERIATRGGSARVSPPRPLSSDLWDPKRSTEVRLDGRQRNEGGVWQLSADGKFVAAAGPGHSIHVWECAAGHLVGSFFGHTDQVVAICFLPENRVVTAANDGDVHIWDFKRSEKLVTIRPAPNTLLKCLATSSDGQFIACGATWRTVHVFDSASGEAVARLEWESEEDDHIYGTRCLAFSPNGSSLASGGNRLRIWDMSTGTISRAFPVEEGGVLAVAFSPDGAHIASASWDESVSLWNTATGNPVWRKDMHTEVRDLDFSYDGRLIACGMQFGCISIVSSANGQQVHSFVSYEGFRAGENPKKDVHLKFAPNSSRIGYVVENGQAVYVLDWPATTVRTHTDHTSGILDIALRADGARAAALSPSDVTIWDTSTGECLQHLRLPRGGNVVTPAKVAFAPDGSRVAAPSWDTTIRVFDVTSGEEVLSLSSSADQDAHATQRGVLPKKWRWVANRRGNAREVAFSDDGRIIAGLSGISRDGRLRLWSASDGSLLNDFPCNGLYGTPFTFLPGSSRLVTAVGPEVVVWDVESGAEVWRFPSHEHDIQEIAISCDGDLLAVLDQKELRLIDLRSGCNTATLTSGQGQPFSGVGFREHEFVVRGGPHVWNISGELIFSSRVWLDREMFANVLAPDFRAELDKGETIITSVAAGSWISSWPKSLEHLKRIPGTASWIGRDGPHVVIIALEGLGDQA